MNEYDLAVIGGGAGGLGAAREASASAIALRRHDPWPARQDRIAAALGAELVLTIAHSAA